MKKHLQRVALLGIVLLMVVIFFYWCFRDYSTLEAIKNHKEFLRSIVDRHYALTAFLYVVIYLAAVVFMVPFISFLSVLGGFLFGAFWGTLFVSGSATIGVAMLVALIRYFLKRDRKALEKTSLEHFNDMIARHGFIYLLCVRLVFVIPFFLVNSLLALTTIPLTTIAWTTFCGILPTTVLFTSAGSYLDQVNSFADIISLRAVGVLGILIVLILAPIFLKKIKILK